MKPQFDLRCPNDRCLGAMKRENERERGWVAAAYKCATCGATYARIASPRPPDYLKQVRSNEWM